MKLMNQRLTLAAVSAVAALMASCANTSHLLVYQHTNSGLNSGINPQTGNLHVRFGYRQDFGCVFPKIKSNAVGDEVKAASSYVASRVRVRGPWQVPDIAEFMATGRAATNLGEKSDALTPFVTPKKDT
jgi:hypothetical protein